MSKQLSSSEIEFQDVEFSLTWYFTTHDGIDYRTNSLGECWERLYGESWESVVCYSEETQLRKAWIEFMKGKDYEHAKV